MDALLGRPGRLVLLSTSCALLLVTARPLAGAADSQDPVAAARRLQEQAAQLGPIPDSGSGITRDVGSIAIIEHDGSSYDAFEPDGTPHYAPRASVAQTFYRTHGDFYDFLVVFTNFEFDTQEAIAINNLVRNDVRGIGKVLADNGRLFGSSGRLLSYVDMADITRYGRAPRSLRPDRPLSVIPGDLGFRDTLSVLSHEVAHQWLAFPRFRDASGQPSSDLLGRDGGHWSALLDSDASVMEGADWQANGDGTYRAARVLEAYSSLDLYLMGLLDPAKVGPITLLHNPTVDRLRVPVEGTTITATAETVSVDQIAAVEGPRVPDHRLSPKAFRVGFIFLTRSGVEPDPEDLEAVERIRQAFAGHFFALTRGVAIADTTLAEGAAAPPAPTPDLDRALAWLLEQQSPDGSWQDAPATALRDTATVLQALAVLGRTTGPYQTGQAWINGMRAPTLDFLARRAIALAAQDLSTAARSALAGEILARQNPDGGFGLAPGYASDPMDTALALSALRALKQPVGPPIQRALQALAGLRVASGGWPFVPGGDSSMVVTASVLLALQDWLSVPEAQPLVAAGLLVLTSRQNPDGGFGESPSTPYSSALALDVLIRAAAPAATVDRVVGYLQATQLPDGSWQGSRYQTALVLGALKGGVAANLVVPADSLTVDPAAPREGQTVHVAARVRNVGRTAAGGSRARLFDGDPRTGAPVAEAAVPPLEPGAEAAVAFDLPTEDRAGPHTLVVLADADQEIAESREDDNATARALVVDGLLPDLVLDPGDLAVTPYPPEDGETVQVSVTVRNSGQRAAGTSRVRLLRGNPRQGGTLIGEAGLPALDIGQGATVTIPWNTTGLTGDWVLFAVADPGYALAESNEANNEVSLPVRVTTQASADPDLELASLTLTPSSLGRIPQTVVVRALVRNLGRTPITSSVALYDGDPPSGTPVGEQPVDLGPRSSVVLTFPISVTASGNRTFVAVADPAGAVAEPDETNNRATSLLVDPRNTLDLEILPAEVTVSSSDLVVGERLTAQAVVRNHGTADAPDVAVQLGHPAGSEVAALAEVHVTVPAGGSAPVTLAWTTAVTADPLALLVRADPFDVLPELSEANNTAALAVRVRPSELPNLRISAAEVAFDPPLPREGSSAIVSAVVRNPSPVPAGSFVVRFFLGDPDDGGVVIGESSVAGLEPAAPLLVAITWPRVDVRGGQGVFVLVDALGQVAEYDETDNRAFRPFTVLGLPDLVLTAADVRLDPGYPRAGEPVTVEATVRNLGAQATTPSTLRALEGEPVGGDLIGEVALPGLAPGESATLTLAWTPAAPPGLRTLSLVADAGNGVVEQDEGNNTVRRSVVVQKADFFLTEPFFSPDGDGVKDDTTLAYRATGAVSVVISDARGRKVRTLATDGPAEGALTWDGRSDAGLLLGDGPYTITLTGEGGRVLARTRAVLDTNRSPLHDAAGTGLLSAGRNLSCQLPHVDTFRLKGPAWMPGDDEVLFIDTTTFRLLRVGLDGTPSVVSTDPFYVAGDFGSDRAVSPDGREVLVFRTEFPAGHQLVAVDLATGTRRPVAQSYDSRFAAWSPDGRWIATRNAVFTREGELIGTLPGNGEWAWSPDSALLALGGRIVRRDGSVVNDVRIGSLPQNQVLQTFWRGDGQVATAVLEGCPEEGSDEGDQCHLAVYLVDPLAGTSRELSWLTSPSGGAMESWSPDGGRLLYRQFRADFSSVMKVANEDGSGSIPLLAFNADASPHATALSYVKDRSSTGPPGTVCAGHDFDVFAVTNAQNLTAELSVVRLPGNNGVLLRGTAADQNLDHFQLEFASREEPTTWHPIGAASEIPVVDDVLSAWIPPAPGTFLVRLRVDDRAGNARIRTRVVSWDRFPVLANISQTEFLISPNGDGVKDTTTFNYLVFEPTNLEVRIAGPAVAGLDPLSRPTVRTFRFDYSALGPQSFTWDGRDEAGQVVADGSYTVLLNDVPFRVEVDATPPDIGWRYENLRTETVKAPVCAKEGQTVPPLIDAGVMAADRVWHVVDPHLRSWALSETPLQGTELVFEPERGPDGTLVLENGLPRVRREGAHAADRRERDEDVAELGIHASSVFTAEDHAGNRSTVPAFPVEERLLVAEARFRSDVPDERQCRPLILPAIDPAIVYPLTPRNTTFTVGETLRDPSARLRFQYQLGSGGPWRDGPLFSRQPWPADFMALGLDLQQAYRGRFTGPGQSGEVHSEEFRFRPCDASLQVTVLQPGTAPFGSSLPGVLLTADVPIRLGQVSFDVRGRVGSQRIDLRRLPMAPVPGSQDQLFVGFFDTPTPACPDRSDPFALPDSLVVSVEAAAVDGRTFTDDGACIALKRDLGPVCPNLDSDLKIRQDYRPCAESSPDRVFLSLRGAVDTTLPGPPTVIVEGGPEAEPFLITRFEQASPTFERELVADVTGQPEGELALRGRITRPGGGHPDLVVTANAFIDRTPPAVEILQPAEGGALCVSQAPDSGLGTLTVIVQARDHSPKLELSAELRPADGPPIPLNRVCLDGACAEDGLVPSGPLVPLSWDVSELPAGEYTIRLSFCDRAGNRSTVERRIFLTREPPALRLLSLTRAVFSPNGDGRSDDTTVTVRTFQGTRLSAVVTTAEGQTVRTLVDDRSLGATDLPITWDGRNDAGQVVPDGSYRVRVTAGDACGRSAMLSASVVVDDTPPSAVFTRPGEGETVGAGVDVRGSADDLHLASFELSFGAGSSPASWSVVAGGAYAVVSDLIARWNTPVTEGAYTLRLVVLDRAENQSEARVHVSVRPGERLVRAGALPSLFSPNGDGRRETTTLEYELKAPARVTVQVTDAAGAPLRTFEAGVSHPAGVFAFVWDGRTDAGSPAPEGDHVLLVHAEDPAGGGAAQEVTAALTLDRTPPTVVIQRPVAGTFVTRSGAVHGSIADPHLTVYTVQVTPPGGAAQELARDGQNRSDFDLAPLASLSDGAYALTVRASDGAENETTLDVPFTVDSVPPSVAFSAPAAGAVLHRGSEPVEVRGRVDDANLESYVLSFGLGPQPVSFVEIGRGTTPGALVRAWSVASIPDETYTLRLVGADRAGQTSEARLTVTLDSVPPVAQIADPAEGAYVNSERPVVGTASDRSLASWTLEASPGSAVSAFQWSPVAAGTDAVVGATLGVWAPPPVDGVYTLRLTVSDAAGHATTAHRAVVIDRTPPAAPTGLFASVQPTSATTADVRLTWNANREPDLAGYRFLRDGEAPGFELLTNPALVDPARPEGRFQYAVTAVDRAGNVSTPASITVRVDLTPPIVGFLRPSAGAAVSGEVEVRGTAFSPDDFKEYRLLVGAGAQPATFSLIRRSTVGVTAGVLGTWVAGVDGPYVLVIEAEDTSGNQARATLAVTVDTQPPPAPVLTDVATSATVPDQLTAVWQPSSATDLAGYLVYRNGRLANAGGIVIGDLTGFLVAGPSYLDAALPDGRHCYRVAAVDRAGNSSVPSNEICRTLDNHPPHAVIVQPANGTRFEFPLRVVAFTADTDVASVQFQYKPHAETVWQDLGAPRLRPPFEATLDPATLTPGSYDLRAVATDEGHRVDPTPESITVVFGDITPPRPPSGVVAHVDGHTVRVSWNPSAEADLAGYRVYRNGQPASTLLTATELAESDVAFGSHDYTVTAEDRDGNVSGPSAAAQAVVYALTLAPPAFPVTAGTSSFLGGSQARPGTTIQILRGSAVIAEGPAGGETFVVPGVVLLGGPNVFTARGQDALGNRSVVSNEVVLISNAPPGAVTGLGAIVSSHTVDLAWNAVTDPDLFGYRVERDGVRLTRTIDQRSVLSVTGTESSSTLPAYAFDGNPGTAWVVGPGNLPAVWTVVFPRPVLVERIHLRLSGSFVAAVPPAHYRILARLQGRFLPLLDVRDNRGEIVDDALPTALATDAVQIVLESPGGLNEVQVFTADLVQDGAVSFTDAEVADGRHRYEVTAVDVYGASGLPASTEAAVGDADPPASPAGLVSAVLGRQVDLTWAAVTDPDLDHYVVLRNGHPVGSVTITTFRDTGLANGTYRYTVRAVDHAGNASGESNAADAVVFLAPAPPATPVILFPTDAAHPITFDDVQTDVRGRADAGSTVSLRVNGEPRGSITARPVLAMVDTSFLGSQLSAAAIAPAGNPIAYAAGFAGSVHVLDRLTGARRLLPVPGYNVVFGLAFSPRGQQLLVAARRFSPFGEDLLLLDLDTGVATLVSDGVERVTLALWSADGRRIAYLSRGLSDASTGLRIRDLATGTVRTAYTTPPAATDDRLSWSPDGTRMAVLRTWLGEQTELRVVDLASGEEALVDELPSPDFAPSWSADGRRLAFTSAADKVTATVTDADGETHETVEVRPHVFVHDFESDQTRSVPDAERALAPAFDPGGRWLSFVQVVTDRDGNRQRTLVARHEATGLEQVLLEPETLDPALSPNPGLHTWFGPGGLGILFQGLLTLFAEEPGTFRFEGVRLSPGENVLVADAEDPASGLVSPASDPVSVTVAGETFPDLVVSAAGLTTTPAAVVAARAASFSARIENAGATDAADVFVRLTVSGPDGSALADQVASVATVPAHGSVVVSLPFTARTTGTHRLAVVVDEDDRIIELHEDNNAAERDLLVTATNDLALAVLPDRDAYPARAPALVRVRLTNAGASFAGSLRTTVEDTAGREIAALDTRDVSVGFGGQLELLVDWNTGSVFAGDYAFRVRASDASGDRAEARAPFRILPDRSVFARVVPDRPTVAEGSAATFSARVENRSVNVALVGLVGHLLITPEGLAAPVFETETPVPLLLPGAVWETRYTWPAASPFGRYTARLELRPPTGPPLAAPTASLVVAPPGTIVSGRLTLTPDGVLVGAGFDAAVSVTNQGAVPLAAYPLAVQVVDGATGVVLAQQTLSLDLLPGQARAATVRLSSAGLTPAAYPVFLRSGDPSVTLDRASLRVHGVVAPPSIDAPPDGSTVDTTHPTLTVNDATSPEGAPLTYEFELYADTALRQRASRTDGIAETPGKTSWIVDVNLAEDRTFYWRARATDGFRPSAWTSVASFTVDAANEPPTSPLPDSPRPGARVATRQPVLVVSNSRDADRDLLTYEFRIAADAGMTAILASASGLTEGPGLTSWPVPVALDEDATYFWSARASDGRAVSTWSLPVSFTVDTENASPGAPTPLRPIGGAAVATLTPLLVVGNAHDPEGDTLTYRFEVDRVPSFDSPARQVSPDVPEGSGESFWIPLLPLLDNTVYYWRASASDGRTTGPAAGSFFFVNLANDPPTAPVLLDPVDGRTVHTSTPTLRLRNAFDADGDALTYVFEVKDAAGNVLAVATGVAEGIDETTWVVTTPLAEDAAFTWRARADDGHVAGEWSAAAAFRVDAVPAPPTAPALVAPPEGAVVATRRPTLIVSNATSPDHLPLTYEFELFAVDASGIEALVERAAGLPEGASTTAFTPSVDLADGAYRWRARASDPVQAGAWMDSARFRVQVEVPPSPPLGLGASPGDGRVSLTWTANPEPDVTGYRVYRALVAGGPYGPVGSSATPAFVDVGLSNGTTHYYVVTAVDAAGLESARSAEASATPVAQPPTIVTAQIRFDPAAVSGQCLLAAGPGGSCPAACPQWLLVTIELPSGLDPSTIDVASVLLGGSVRPDPGYAQRVDVDQDGVPELQLRVAFASLVDRLTTGSNVLTVVGRAPAVELRGTAVLSVSAVAVDMLFTPRTLQRRSQGADIQVQLTPCGNARPDQIDTASLRLNGQVPISRVVSLNGQKLIVKFDRPPVIAILPVGEAVTVRVTGTIRGLAFEAQDVIRVIE